MHWKINTSFGFPIMNGNQIYLFINIQWQFAVHNATNSLRAVIFSNYLFIYIYMFLFVCLCLFHHWYPSITEKKSLLSISPQSCSTKKKHDDDCSVKPSTSSWLCAIFGKSLYSFIYARYQKHRHILYNILY